MLVARNSTGIHSLSYHFGGKPCYSWDLFIERLVLVARISTGIHSWSYHFWGAPCYSRLVARNSEGSIVLGTILGVNLAIAG